MATKVVYVRADVGVVEIVALILLALVVVYCMLGGGYSATGLLRGWIGRRSIARAPAAAHQRQQLEAQARAHSVAIARSHPNTRSFASHDDRLPSRNMLSAAVNKHNASTAAPRPVDQLFSSSPPIHPRSNPVAL